MERTGVLGKRKTSDDTGMMESLRFEGAMDNIVANPGQFTERDYVSIIDWFGEKIAALRIDSGEPGTKRAS